MEHLSHVPGDGERYAAKQMMQQDDILEQIRRRPAMFTGEDSLRSIYHFLSGYSFALDRHSVATDTDPLILPGQFHDWVAYRLHFYESTSGWCNMISARTSTEPDAIDRFFQLLSEFNARIPHTVAKLKGYEKTYHQSAVHRSSDGNLCRAKDVSCRYPDSISLVTYTDDPGFFAYSDDGTSFPSEGFHPDLESFELQTGASRSLLTIIDKCWHPRPHAHA
jgi:hypothetical protein